MSSLSRVTRDWLAWGHRCCRGAADQELPGAARSAAHIAPALGGIFKALSFLGLATGLILVSFFYQRFVFKRSP